MKDKPAFKRGLVFLAAWMLWFFSGAAYGLGGAGLSEFSLQDTTPAFKIFFALWALVSSFLLYYALVTLMRSFQAHAKS